MNHHDGNERDYSVTASTDLEEDGYANPSDEENHDPNKPFQERADAEQIDGGAVEKTATGKSANPSVNNVKAIPNGGLRAWLQVLGAFFLFFNSWFVWSTDFAWSETRINTIAGESSTHSEFTRLTMRAAFCLRHLRRTSPGLDLSRLSFSWQLAP